MIWHISHGFFSLYTISKGRPSFANVENLDFWILAFGL
jgi:hypothetical protein